MMSQRLLLILRSRGAVKPQFPAKLSTVVGSNPSGGLPSFVLHVVIDTPIGTDMTAYINSTADMSGCTFMFSEEPGGNEYGGECELGDPASAAYNATGLTPGVTYYYTAQATPVDTKLPIATATGQFTMPAS